MTLRVSDLQSDSDLDSIRNSFDVFILGKGSEWAHFSVKAQNGRVGPADEEGALYGYFNIQVKNEIPNEYGYLDIDSTIQSILMWDFNS